MEWIIKNRQLRIKKELKKNFKNNWQKWRNWLAIFLSQNEKSIVLKLKVKVKVKMQKSKVLKLKIKSKSKSKIQIASQFLQFLQYCFNYF